MILRSAAPAGSQHDVSVYWQPTKITHEQRANQKAQRPCILWFTGLSGAGKSTIANAVEQALFLRGHHSYLLDGDNIRHGLNKDLDFSDAGRVENVRRIGEVAKLFVDAGMIVVTAFISPFRSDRRLVRDLVAAGRVRRSLRLDAARGLRAARPEGPVQEGARRGAQELHRHHFALRGAGGRGDHHRQLEALGHGVRRPGDSLPRGARAAQELDPC